MKLVNELIDLRWLYHRFFLILDDSLDFVDFIVGFLWVYLSFNLFLPIISAGLFGQRLIIIPGS